MLHSQPVHYIGARSPARTRVPELEREQVQVRTPILARVRIPEPARPRVRTAYWVRDARLGRTTIQARKQVQVQVQVQVLVLVLVLVLKQCHV